LLPTGATAEMEQSSISTIFHFNSCIVRQQGRCIVPKAVYTVKNCSWESTNLSPGTCRAKLKNY